MALMDKFQAAYDKLTKDDTRLNSAELTMIQQAYTLGQLGYIKAQFAQRVVQDEGIRHAIQEIADEFLKPGLAKPRSILERASAPSVNLNWETRGNGPNAGATGSTPWLNDQEILLDTMYWLQASVSVAQAAALAAVRGDVREYFLNQRDQGMDHWRKLALLVYKHVPNAIPPQVQVTGPTTL